MSVFSYNYLNGINLFEKNRKFKITYSKVDGLSMSNPVTLNGFKIGKVHKINFNLYLQICFSSIIPLFKW